MVPEVRFKGFTDDWELRKLGTLYKINRERNLIGITKDKTISISSMSFNASGNNANISSIPNYKVLRIGDLAYEGHTNRSFSFGRFVLNDIGTGIMSPRFSSLRPIKNMNVNYWKHYIHYEPIMKYILVKSTKRGTMMNELVPNDLFKQQIHVPSDMEQNKIGQLLNLLDISITLQQRQLDLYIKLKKGLLQKLFPKDGEKVPEVRFADFTGDWKQRNLKNVISGDISDGDWREKQHIFSKGEYRIIQTGNLSSEGKYKDKTNSAKFIRKNDFNELKANEIFPKDILISRLAAPAGRTIILPDIGHKMVTAVDITIIRPNKNFDSYYIKTLMNSNLILRRIEKKITGTTHQRISRKNLEKTILNVPSNIQEQIKMGNFFKQLDKIINLENNKLENLTFFKKYLLQKLFI